MQGVLRQPFALVINGQEVARHHQLHRLAHQPRRNRIPIRPVAHQAVHRHRATRSLDQSISRVARRRNQGLFRERFRRNPMRRSVFPPVRHLQAPPKQFPVQMLEAFKDLSGKEVSLHVFDPAFHLPLRPRTIRPAQPRGISPIPSEVLERRVQTYLLPVVFEGDRLRVVVEDFTRPATEVLERRFVAPQERRDFFVQGRSHEGPAAVAQDHHEKRHPDRLAAHGNEACSPIHLRLLAGQRFKPNRRFFQTVPLLPQRSDEPLHLLVTARVAFGLQFLEQYHRAIAHLREPHRRPFTEFVHQLSLRLANVRFPELLLQPLPHRLNMKTQRPGNRLLSYSLGFKTGDRSPFVPVDHRILPGCFQG